MQIVIDQKLLEKKISSGNFQFIELCIVPSENDSGAYHPAFLHLGGIRPDNTYEDLEGVDECAVANQFVRKSA